MLALSTTRCGVVRLFTNRSKRLRSPRRNRILRTRSPKALVEHPFGTMKRGMDQGYFLLKGLRKVRGEFSLTVLTYNLKRVLNIVEVPQLLDALA